MKSKAEFKALKKRITEETAANVGYCTEVLKHIPEYALLEAVRQSAILLNTEMQDAELRNVLVTESVKAMAYQDFKDIAGMFFGSR